MLIRANEEIKMTLYMVPKKIPATYLLPVCPH